MFSGPAASLPTPSVRCKERRRRVSYSALYPSLPAKYASVETGCFFHLRRLHCPSSRRTHAYYVHRCCRTNWRLHQSGRILELLGNKSPLELPKLHIKSSCSSNKVSVAPLDDVHKAQISLFLLACPNSRSWTTSFSLQLLLPLLLILLAAVAVACFLPSSKLCDLDLLG